MRERLRASDSAAEPQLALVSLKAFGDLVIAAAAVRTVDEPARTRLRLLAGEHLVELLQVLRPPCQFTIIDHGESGVPALFDLRKCGPARGIKSAAILRGVMGALALPSDTTLVFDRLGARERLIAGHVAAVALPPEPQNIYFAYDELFNRARLSATASAPLSLAGTLKVGIFPGSRMSHKNVPLRLLARLAATVRSCGWHSLVFTLAGEPEVTDTLSPAIRLTRSFAALAEALVSVDAVISADSLPGHLAEYLGRPAFVVSPVPNNYWLPRYAFLKGHCAEFANPTGMEQSLTRFLDGLDAVNGPSSHSPMTEAAR